MSGWGLPPTFDRYTPSLWGLVAYTVTPGLANGTFSPASGDIVALLTPIAQPVVITNAYVNITIAGVTLTGGENFIGAADGATGLLRGVTADQSAAWLGTGNMAPAAIATGPLTMAPPYFWSLILVNGTTAPTFRAGAATPGSVLGPSIGSASIPVPYQRAAAGAIALASFTPAQSGVGRNSIMVGWS